MTEEDIYELHPEQHQYNKHQVFPDAFYEIRDDHIHTCWNVNTDTAILRFSYTTIDF